MSNQIFTNDDWKRLTQAANDLLQAESMATTAADSVRIPPSTAAGRYCISCGSKTQPCCGH